MKFKIGDRVKAVNGIAEYNRDWPATGVIVEIFEGARYPVLATFGKIEVVFSERELVKLEEVKKEDLM